MWFIVGLYLVSGTLLAFGFFRNFFEATWSASGEKVGYGGRYVPAVILQFIFIGAEPVKLSGVYLDIRAHFAKVESILFITLILTPGNGIIPCMIGKSTHKAEP